LEARALERVRAGRAHWPLQTVRAPAPMSVRTLRDCAEHVAIRGTSVSLSFAAPSVLHVSVVHKFGLPNRNGVISCDNHLLYLRFDKRNDGLVHVWAAPIETDGEGWSCLIM
jgi:hypothetical protein